MRWAVVGEGPAVGKTLAELNLRVCTGAQAVVARRDGEIYPIVDANAPLQIGDTLGLIGTADQTAAAEELLEGRGYAAAHGA